jgi:uncharacterized membrane protein YqjE
MNSSGDSIRRPERASVLRLFGQVFGAIVSSVTALIWLAVLWLPSEREVLGHFGVVGAVVMLFVAILGVLSAHRGHGNFMLAMFLAAFLPIGAYMLWTTQPMYRWLGLLNLLYLVAAIVVRSTRREAAVGDREGIDR